MSIEDAHQELRRNLGLRPETRIDNIIFRDGTAYQLQPGGYLVRVR